jgi:hypothetical protein
VAAKTEWQGRILAVENRRLEQQKSGNGATNRTTAGSWPLCSPSTRRLNQTAIYALELLRLGARKESKKENSGKTCEQRKKLSRGQIKNETRSFPAGNKMDRRFTPVHTQPNLLVGSPKQNTVTTKISGEYD